MIDGILELIERNSGKWFGSSILKPEMNYFFTAGSTLLQGKIILFIFRKPTRSPIAVVKIARNAMGTEGLYREYENLRLLHSSYKQLTGIPRPLHYGTLNNSPFLIQSFLPGLSLKKSFPQLFLTSRMSGNVENIVDSVFNWLIRFHMRTQQRIKGNDYFVNDQEGDQHQLIGDDSSFSIGTVQGDYWIGNILIDDLQVNVVDWEWGMHNFPLAWDAFFFSATLIRYIIASITNKSTPDDLVPFIENNGHWCVGLLKKRIARYCHDFDIGDSLKYKLFHALLLFLGERDPRRYGVQTDESIFWSGVVRSMDKRGIKKLL